MSTAGYGATAVRGRPVVLHDTPLAPWYKSLSPLSHFVIQAEKLLQQKGIEVENSLQFLGFLIVSASDTAFPQVLEKQKIMQLPEFDKTLVSRCHY